MEALKRAPSANAAARLRARARVSDDLGPLCLLRSASPRARIPSTGTRISPRILFVVLLIIVLLIVVLLMGRGVGPDQVDPRLVWRRTQGLCQPPEPLLECDAEEPCDRKDREGGDPCRGAHPSRGLYLGPKSAYYLKLSMASWMTALAAVAAALARPRSLDIVCWSPQLAT